MASEIPFAFVGTAKSEYYVRSEDGSFLRHNFQQTVESWVTPNSVYYPWERALLACDRCKLVSVRDTLTSKCLQNSLPRSASSKVRDLGNPMMDNVGPTGALDWLQSAHQPDRCLTLLPGSRKPEMYSNFSVILSCVEAYLTRVGEERTLFLVPVGPSADEDEMAEVALSHGWLKLSSAWASDFIREEKHPESLKRLSFFGRNVEAASSELPQCLMAVGPGCFGDCIQLAEAGIAMAGTATEQLVGLGKPAFTLPGGGPQFTEVFAEAQTRLLGQTVMYRATPHSLADAMVEVLGDEKLKEMEASGRHRMGTPGASLRIAEHILLNLIG